MATFTYAALKENGERDQGVVEAANRQAAFESIRRRGLRPLSLEEEGAQVRGKEAQGETSQVRMRSLPVLHGTQLIAFTEELSELLEAGLQLEPALRIIAERQEKSALKGIAVFLRRQVRDGISFSQALKNCGRSFSPLYCNMVAAGEAGGALPQILRRQCDYLTMMDELQRRVVSALIYPSIVFSSAIILLFVFLTFLVPQLTNLLSKTGQQLPLVTRMLVATSDFCFHWWWAILGLGGLVIVGSWKFIHTPAGRAWWDRVVLELPLVGPVVRMRFLAQLLQTLATLMINGVALLQALLLMRSATPNTRLKALLGKVAEMVGEGVPLSRAMKKVGFFPSMLIDILSVGEQTGEIGGALERAARKYDRELTSRIQHITTLIQPLVIFIIAAFVGVVAYSMIAGILTSVNALRPR